MTGAQLTLTLTGIVVAMYLDWPAQVVGYFVLTIIVGGILVSPFYIGREFWRVW